MEYVIITNNVGSTTVTNADNSAPISINGVTNEYKEYEDLEMITGRFINEEDDNKQEKFCVVSDQFVSDIGLSEYTADGSPIRIVVNGYLQEFTIIGIYHYESETNDKYSTSTSIQTNMYMPPSTAKYLTKAKEGYSSFTVISQADIDTSWFLDETQKFFESFYTQNDSYTVSVSNMEATLETISEMLSTVTLAISCIAAVSLLVGGIGVMNIMLVSITKRTKEIGTRKALGATNNEIRTQFIIEATIVCVIGGIMGIILGLILGSVGSNILGYEALPNVSSVVYSVLFSMLIGVFFGYYPANKAANLNPIDALRYE